LNNNSIHDYRFKGVFYLLPDHLSDYIKNSSGQILIRIIEDAIFGSSKLLVMPHNHRFFASFHEKTEQIVPYGLIDHFYRETKDSFNQKGFAPSSLENFKPMSLEHLEAGFVVWAVTLMLPIAAFIFEWIFKCIVNLKCYFVFRTIFLVYLGKLKDDVMREKTKTKRTKRNETNKTEVL
jgi:hypothetical protein